ncbi:glycoside hydrolase family 15 protein [Candidatus Mycobacterium wuenschmannii]|uniref:Glycoside hydrolase family 15 protein n=1 Tax=Candidatus Mycobacterium wuenschmannii TaxID=3027808 RepID=A0ABY8VWJ0_9MYCO|nr:glycoside hydrolase family 15 protein [Candidatus Mycobacterium wuenschmannii]WIM88010.1 glycoside hydrolase family 15 protein [Candidatus Mycobacterium wuenschmannii]
MTRSIRFSTSQRVPDPHGAYARFSHNRDGNFSFIAQDDRRSRRPELDPETTLPSESPNRRAGFADLRSYAAIGDGRTIALVALDGAIDWLPLPDLDSMPVFAALLDQFNGGRIELTPTVPFTSRRRYVGDTNVLETTFVTESGCVQVTDALNVGVAGRLPWSELGRRIEGVSGTVPMRWCVAPGTRLNTASPWARDTPHGTVCRIADLTVSVCVSDGMTVDRTDQSVSGTFEMAHGDRRIIGLVASEAEPLMLSDARNIDRGIDRTVTAWSQWFSQLGSHGPWDAALHRSALALKLLIYAPTGAIAAAATTSLPECLAGGKNWDYRYAWIRDAAYTLSALRRLGIREETHAAVSWLLRTVRQHGPQVGVFFTLDGSVPEDIVTHEVPGWRGIEPVVTGNWARCQRQLSIFADLFDMVRLYVDAGHVLDTDTGHLMADWADQACDDWRRRDAGMWELSEQQHFTSSKIGCWQALRCAVHLVDVGQIPGDASRWAAEADRIAEWVDRNCWSDELQSYEWYPGSGQLDASVLLHAGSGFNRGARMSATIDAIRRELSVGPLMYRYSGAREEGEGTFVACAFWTVSALHHVGRNDEARTLMDTLVALTNDVGILAEMIDPSDNAFLGNLPQGLSHLALIGAALDLGE